jgi:hypothetical protein
MGLCETSLALFLALFVSYFFFAAFFFFVLAFAGKIVTSISNSQRFIFKICYGGTFSAHIDKIALK